MLDINEIFKMRFWPHEDGMAIRITVVRCYDGVMHHICLCWREKGALYQSESGEVARVRGGLFTRVVI